MNSSFVPPSLAALPLPASLDALKGLLVAGETAFLVPFSMALGWPIMLLVAEVLGRTRGDTSLRRLAAWLARRIPGAIAFAIILGMLPFYVGNLLYGFAVMPAAQHMAWYVVGAVPVLFLGYAASWWVALRRRGSEPSTLRPFLPDIVESYLLAFRRRGLERPGLIMTLFTVPAMLALGFVLAAHSVLMLRPELWGPVAGVPSGVLLPVHEPQFIPFLLHMFLTAMGISGFMVAWHGADRMADGEMAYGGSALVFGGIWFTVSFGFQAFAGPWFVLSLPQELSRQFLGGVFSSSAIFWTGMAAGFLALALVGFAMFSPEPRTFIWMAAGLVVCNLVSMVISHQCAREAVLDELLGLGTRSVDPQKGMFLLFAIVLVLATAAISWMIWVTSRVQKPQ